VRPCQSRRRSDPRSASTSGARATGRTGGAGACNGKCSESSPQLPGGTRKTTGRLNTLNRGAADSEPEWPGPLPAPIRSARGRPAYAAAFWKRHSSLWADKVAPCERAEARCTCSRVTKSCFYPPELHSGCQPAVATGRQPEPRPSYGLHSRRPLPAGSLKPELAECHHLADLIPAPGSSDCESDAEGPIAPQAGLEVT
jgi:hypothetical protein